jgi:hypothetical protein
MARRSRSAWPREYPASELLLVDDDPVGILEDRLQLRQVVDHFLAAVLAVDEIIHHARTERARAIQGAGGDDILETGWLEFDQHFFHAG